MILFYASTFPLFIRSAEAATWRQSSLSLLPERQTVYIYTHQKLKEYINVPNMHKGFHVQALHTCLQISGILCLKHHQLVLFFGADCGQLVPRYVQDHLVNVVILQRNND